MVCRSSRPATFPRARATRAVAVAALLAAGSGAGMFSAGGTAAADLVSIPFTATKGDRFSVRVTKQIAETKNGTSTNEGPFSFNYDGEVLDASASGSRMRWTLKSVFMPGSAADNEALSAGMLALMKGIPLEFDAGPNGAPVRIPNFKEILPRLMDVTRKILSSDGEQPDPQVMERTEASFRAMSPQVAAANFLPEAMVVGAMQNLILDPNEPRRTEASQRNPLGGPPIKMVTQTRLSRTDRVSGFAVITWETAFDRTSIVESTKALMQSMRRPGEKELPQEALDIMSKMKVDRNDRGTALVSLKDGWVRKLHYRQKITNELQDQSQSKDETWLIEIDRMETPE